MSEIIHIGQLIPDPQNARRHTPRNVGMIESALHEVGAARSIVVDEDGVILAGNATVEAAAQAGIERVRVVEADGNEIIAVRRRGLTPEQKTKLALFDNRAAELADWDAGALAALGDMVDLSGLFYEDELQAILDGASELPTPGDGGDDFDPTPQDGPTRTALGDLWAIGPHRLLVADCTDPTNVERLMGGERADAVVSDPPYGQNQDGVTNDEPEGLRELFDGCLAVLPADNAVVIVFQSTRLFPMWLDAIRSFDHKFERALTYYDTGGWSTFPWRGWMPHSQIILVSSVGKPRWAANPTYVRDVYSVNNQLHADSTFVSAHPTMKHLDTVQSLVEHATDSGIVYDPFLGSGTTMVAAHRVGRRCYGMEIAPRYADVILRRAEAEGLTCERIDA